MDLKVVPIYPCLDICSMLRRLADKIENKEIEATRVTVITSHGHIYNYGSTKEDCALHSIFDCNLAIKKILDGCTVYV